MVYSGTIRALWLILLLYWIVAATGAKRNVGSRQRFTASGLRVGGVLILAFALQAIPVVRQTLHHAESLLADRPMVRAIGAGICALGVGLALWARIHLGKNWGMPMSTKENAELVTTGPYAVVRHPIYTGILLAMLGSTLGESLFWLLPLVLFGAYFVYSARREEKLMLALFPEQYPPYVQRTSMLLPRIFRRS